MIGVAGGVRAWLALCLCAGLASCTGPGLEPPGAESSRDEDKPDAGDGLAGGDGDEDFGNAGTGQATGGAGGAGGTSLDPSTETGGGGGAGGDEFGGDGGVNTDDDGGVDPVEEDP